MLTTLLLLVLATLGTWDILKRLLPVQVPVLLGKLACVAIPLCLLNWTPHAIVLALCVPGVLLILSWLTGSTEPVRPWGPYVADLLRLLKLRRKPQQPGTSLPDRIGHRIPRL